MFRQRFKWLAILYFFSALVFGQTPSNSTPLPLPPSTSSSRGIPPVPVEQALIPEGVFAQELVDALKLGPIADQAKAEALLSSLGIEPKNGWISEYPVTPAVLGDIDNDIAAVCEQGRIALPKDQVIKKVNALKARLGFNISLSPNTPPLTGQPPNPGNTKIYSYIDNKGMKYFTDDFDSIPPEYRDHAKLLSQPSSPGSSAVMPSVPPDWSGTQPLPQAQQYGPMLDPNILDSYYQDQGPPVVTYYSPPSPYDYLYSWVPYPFWSTGIYFTGFYVLNNFQKQIIYNNIPYHLSHHVGPGSINNATYHRGSGNGWYPAGNAQAGARAIVKLEQNHQYNTFNHPQFQTPAQQARPFAAPRNLNNAPATNNRPGVMPRPMFQPSQQIEGRVYNQVPQYRPNPGFEERQFRPNPAYNPGFEEHRIINSPQIYGGGGGGHIEARPAEGGRGGRR